MMRGGRAIMGDYPSHVESEESACSMIAGSRGIVFSRYAELGSTLEVWRKGTVNSCTLSNECKIFVHNRRFREKPCLRKGSV
jgi:hypothetical protein